MEKKIRKHQKARPDPEREDSGEEVA